MSKNYEKKVSAVGGIVWSGENLARNDGGFSILKEFIEENHHEDWSLSIYDVIKNATAEIDCKTDEIPQIVSFIYCSEHANPLLFVAENPLTECYVVGMRCTMGKLKIPGIYIAKDGKLLPM